MFRLTLVCLAILFVGGCTLRSSRMNDPGRPIDPYGGPYRQGPAMGNVDPLPRPTEPPPTRAVEPVDIPVPPVAEPLPPPPAPLVVKYKIRQGDILGRISQRFYGTSKMWQKIADHNRLDPKKLKVGQVIEIPEPTQGLDD